jgi:hypothetical protein
MSEVPLYSIQMATPIGLERILQQLGQRFQFYTRKDVAMREARANRFLLSEVQGLLESEDTHRS